MLFNAGAGEGVSHQGTLLHHSLCRLLTTSALCNVTTRCFESLFFFAQIAPVLFFSLHLLTIKFVPNHQGIYQTAFRSVVSVEISGKQVLIRAHQRKTCPEVHAEGSAVKKVLGSPPFPRVSVVGFAFGLSCGSATLCPLR